MSVTLYDISEKAGVSTATVSRVINDSPLVTEKTRQKVMKIIEELQYHPNPAARSLAGQTTQTLGVLFPDFDSGFYTEVLLGIDEEAARRNYHIMTGFSHGVEDEERLLRHYLFSRRIDALVVMNLTFSSDFLQEVAESARIPVILLDRPFDGPHMAGISMNNEQGAEKAMHHLVDTHGYRDICIIRGPFGNYDTEGRMCGILRAVEQLQLSIPSERIIDGDFTENSGFLAMDEMIRSGRTLPDAIFAMNDAMALGALSALSAAGIRVPEEVAIMGFDDIISARHMRLSTVKVPMREMGRYAAQAALQSVLEKETPVSRVVDLDLTIRSTCGCA
ncbi:MAG: LacI family DNA-binding transcriptional regulator [Kiritimatiellae bacterium]|nr:LacI family DNA-binding transcriptional regulator [Kiritimatiellia bacterium]MDD4737588.1 LacI family DNA-binding transcriptional regulator [Kiritimatiellia bacterium]